MLRKIKKILKKNKIIYNTLQKIRFFLSKTLKPKYLYFLMNSKYPISDYYGLDRGEPIDRYYIEKFLDENRGAIKGDCLELLDNCYTKRFGGNNVSRSDILDIDENNDKANIHGDLRDLNQIPDNQYDCIILTQVLQFIDDLPASINECYRILKPGGVILITVPSLSRVDCISGAEGDYWRFTTASLRYLLGKKFTENNLVITSYGNVLSAVNFLMGFSSGEIGKKIDFNDKNFPCLVTAKAKK